MFSQIKLQVQRQFEALVSLGVLLFYVDIDKDKIWDLYLSGFEDPAERQGHNCNSCKSFLRQYAGIVAIVDNKILTLWNFVPLHPLFQKSIHNLHTYVLSRPITDVFLNSFSGLGTDKNTDSKDSSLVWNHFYISLPRAFVHKGTESIESRQGNLRDNKAVLKRSLDELTVDAVDTVLELIGQNSLYRGKEFETALAEFKTVQLQYLDVPKGLRDNFCWVTSLTCKGVTRIRNTAIGTLLINLSEGMDLDAAVGKFEAVVAPSNYKRPTALITPRMIEDAKEKIEELGYMDALERRFAQPGDLNVTDMLFVDRSSSLTDVFEDMKKDATVNPREFSKVEEIELNGFIEFVLPKAKAVYALVENTHIPNMVTLLTSQNSQAANMFKWDNGFSWEYTGGITDSIKERVKQAGGKVDGELRISLSWHNFDDLDLHVVEPDHNEIYYRNKVNRSTGGQLDVDMNAGAGTTREPVENIIWPESRLMRAGMYQVIVHNFARREGTNSGYTLQIECRGEVYEINVPNNPRGMEYAKPLVLQYDKVRGLIMPADVQANVSIKEKWGLKTNRFHKVKAVMQSPNHWESNKVRSGNEHCFFILENCASDTPTRPFFNEFLKEELTPYRKFFEVLGNKLVISPTTSQVAGLGFSETQRNHLYVRVEGAMKRILKINF